MNHDSPSIHSQRTLLLLLHSKYTSDDQFALFLGSSKVPSKDLLESLVSPQFVKWKWKFPNATTILISSQFETWHAFEKKSQSFDAPEHLHLVSSWNFSKLCSVTAEWYGFVLFERSSWCSSCGNVSSSRSRTGTPGKTWTTVGPCAAINSVGVIYLCGWRRCTLSVVLSKIRTAVITAHSFSTKW